MGLMKNIFTNVRIIILLVFIVLAVVAIHPNPGAEGVTIRSVDRNSTASLAGIESPNPSSTPMSKERVLFINNEKVLSVEDYNKKIAAFDVNKTVQLKTTKGFYQFRTEPAIELEYLDEFENVTFNETVEVNKTVNGTSVLVNETIEKVEERQKTIAHVVGVKDIGIHVYEAPTTNIKKGLDLQGGTRVMLQPEKILSDDDLDILLANLKERLNVFGLSDVVVREAKDLSGNQFILVEIAGASEEEVRDLLARQGKFEAKINNQTVFSGGDDVTYVCRTADCSGIDPRVGCGQHSATSWSCAFSFSISLSPEAAQRQSEVTNTLDIIDDDGREYLSEQLILYLDDAEVDQLNIGADLKGRPVTDIQISGSGLGATQQDAVFDALANMKRMQTILVTGSLPVKLNVVKTDSVSPTLGKDFTKNAIVMGIFAILAVSLVVFLRYKSAKVAVPMVFAMGAEVMILLGLAALIQWNIDIAAIAGIIVAVGTGVDDQIVITDETLRGQKERTNWKERLKRAFFIIMGAYFTVVVAMVPLLFAGAGIIKGFALTTIIGVTIGVFVSRPAYAALVEILLKD